MNSYWSRLAPGVVVTALLCLAAAAPQPRGAGPAPPPQAQPPCDDFAIAVAGDDSVMLMTRMGVEQVLPAGMSVAACSLRAVAVYGSFMTLRMREWDPTTLAPDPDAIALRQTFFNGSSLLYTGGKLPRTMFVPPIVVNSVPGVAEPPKPHVAMELVADYGYWQNEPRVYFTREGPPELPAAVKINADSTREPLPGPHPVLAHAVCAGDSDLAALRVVQSVSRADVKPFPAPKEFLQRFRVPQQTELRWIQLVLAELFFPYFQRAGDEAPMMGVRGLPVLAVIDGDDMATPEPDMPTPMVEASFATFGFMSWVTTQDLDRTVMLEPGHDYWIWVRDAASATFMNRRVHGDEPLSFAYGVGPYFGRTDSAGTWIRAADQVLVFRIVGKPTAPPPPPPAPPRPTASAFALSTTPNPAQGIVRVDWSGALGPVRFEVIDARGRRVSEGSGGAAGTWTWPGTDRDGRAVASGIYFVRARDSAGQLGTQRVMIVR